MKTTLPIFFAAVLSAGVTSVAQENWYTRSFFLLHEDHHTTDLHEVGRDADPRETARLVNLAHPDGIQIHAKGNPGWTTYPSKIGFSPRSCAATFYKCGAISRTNT